MCVRSIRSSDDDAYVSVDISQLHIATPFQDFNLKRSAFTSVHFSVFVFVCVCVFCVWSGGGLLTCHEFGKFQFLSFLEFEK